MTDIEHIDEEGIHLLIQAIIKQAMTDYKYALCGRTQGHSYGPLIDADAMEKWFLSQYGQLLSDGHGERIIEKCRSEVDKQTTMHGMHRKTRERRERRELPAPRKRKKKPQEVRRRRIVATLETDCTYEQVQTVKKALAAYLEQFADATVTEVHEVRLKREEVE